jgi:FAD/FMN-containing dehydrogenase
MEKAIKSTSSSLVRDLAPYSNFGDMFADKNEDDRYARKLFGENYRRLQQVKMQYDPDEHFSRWYGIKPALV